MAKTRNISSSPGSEERLRLVSLEDLHEHPLNSNHMEPGLREKLRLNIEIQDQYPPLVVRPHPDLPGGYQLLDGVNRAAVLRELGRDTAECYVWPCDDKTALILLSTLNRLEGQDIPYLRSQLLAELQGLVSVEDLAELVPESPSEMEDLLASMDIDSDALMDELSAAAETNAKNSPRLISFSINAEDSDTIEQAVLRAMQGLTGENRRGNALGTICRHYLEENHA